MTSVQESQCVLCGNSNNCMANCQKTCWCMTVDIPETVLAKVPDDKKNKACICLSCIEQLSKEARQEHCK